MACSTYLPRTTKFWCSLLFFFVASPSISGAEPEVLIIIKALAKLGDPVAQHQLGEMYYKGNLTSKNYSKAAKWFRKAAIQDHAPSQHSLGVLYFNGHGVVQNYSEAIKWYLKAAEQNYSEAQHSLGRMYHRGTGVSQDFKKARKSYLKAAEQGHLSAQLRLAMMYDAGEGMPHNYQEAYRWYIKVAEKEFVYGLNGLAWLLATCPDDTIRDGDKAVEYAERALLQENSSTILDTLAAAYAEAGRFEEAIETQLKAIDIFRDEDIPIEECFIRLNSYKNNKPWREVAKKIAPR